MKQCRKCNEIKNIEEFHKAKQHKDGHKWTCKICEYKQHKIWVKKNPEKVRKTKHEWYLKNMDRIKYENKRNDVIRNLYKRDIIHCTLDQADELIDDLENHIDKHSKLPELWERNFCLPIYELYKMRQVQKQ